MFDIATIYKKQVEEIDTQLKNEMMRVAITWGIDINEEKLVKALTDARAFYDEGYEDGRRDAIDGLVRCKDCKEGEVDDPDFPDQYYCHAGCGWNKEDFFCAYGERKDGDGNG